MHVITTLNEWRNIRKTLDHQTKGFVPTMGNLHEGHGSLLQRSKAENAVTLLSLFINPTQFDSPSDLAQYPKTLEADLILAQKWGADYVFIPQPQEMYPDGFNFRVSEHSPYGQWLEGAHRPGHFTGMLTVVLKLLIMSQADRAYFGEKDYQQLTLVTRMCEAFLLDVQIVPCPTVRDESGLPLSSRNSLLTSQDLKKAALFSQLLASPESDETVEKQLHDAGFEVDYIAQDAHRRFGAVKLKGVRLIDNVEAIK